MSKQIKRRLKKLEKALQPKSDINLIAERFGGIITWNGVEYSTEEELHKAFMKEGISQREALVILERFSEKK